MPAPPGFDRAAWAPIPEDLPTPTALEINDVCAAVSQTRAVAPADGTVWVLGAGHAGKLVRAAARDAMKDGTVIAVDRDEDAIERVEVPRALDIGVAADLRDSFAHSKR